LSNTIAKISSNVKKNPNSLKDLFVHACVCISEKEEPSESNADYSEDE